MTDKEMIVERGMVKLDIEEIAGSYLVFINDIRINKNKPLSTSKTVMSFNCPKKYILPAIGIPEGSVVLSKEEYLNDFNNQFNKGCKHGSKETAREILKEILFVKGIKGWQKNKQLVAFGNRIVDKIDELAKQFGVEIKEKENDR